MQQSFKHPYLNSRTNFKVLNRDQFADEHRVNAKTEATIRSAEYVHY